jgi:PAS domain S-box-containing protein
VEILCIGNDFTERKKAEDSLLLSEDRYTRLFEDAVLGIFRSTPDGKIIHVNPAYARMFGFDSPEETKSRVNNVAVELYVNPPRRDELVRIILDTRGPVHAENVYRRKDGSSFTGKLHAWAVRDAEGKPLYIEGFVEDITERKRAEAALRESEEFKNAILDSMPSHIAVLDRNGVILSVNQPWVRFAIENGTSESLPAAHTGLGVNYLKVCRESLGESSEGTMAAHDGIRAVLDGTLPSFGLEYPCHSPRINRFFSMMVTPLGTGARGVVISHRDITQRKQAEQKAVQLSAIVESSDDVIIGKNLDGIITSWNRGAERIYGYTESEVIGKPISILLPPEHQNELPRILGKIMSGEHTEHFETVRRRKDGRDINMSLTISPVRNPEGKIVGASTIGRDITERKQSEKALKDSEARLDLAIRSAHMGVWSWDVLEDKRHFDHQVCHLLGIDPAAFTGKAEEFFQAVHPDDRESVRAAMHRVLTEDVTYDTEYRAVWPDGSVHSITARGRLTRDEAGRPKEINGVIWDITESKRLEDERERVEAQLRQAQKMESLGTLSGGIAHDFNNILGIIMGYTDMALSQKDKGSDEYDQLNEVLKATIRAKDLVKHILAFSRPSKETRQPLQVSLIVKEALKMLRATLPSTISTMTNVTSKAVVMADPTQIHQVLMNLCTNAAHAMQEDGGTLEVSLTDALLVQEDIPPLSELQPGPHIKLTVKDTGRGISPSILDRIFDPFFTTKEKGTGTGLGLSVVHGIVKSHGGSIEVRSLPGKGTTFHVFLPSIGKAPATEPAEFSPIPRGRERVLVVDDESTLAEAVKRMLERLGYKVDFRPNGVEALEAFRNQPPKERFDLVITDMTMPHLTGIDLAKELLKLDPKVAIILCTGFSEKADDDKAGRIGIRGFLMKPVVLRELAEMVRKVLDAKIK